MLQKSIIQTLTIILKMIDFADIMVGGYGKYSLNSEGTIYTDYDGAINYEYGAYLQVKSLLERLKLTGSIRYDKSEFFDGFYYLELVC